MAFLALALTALSVQAQQPDLARLDSYIADAVAAWEIPGLAVAVVRDDSVIFARGYGERTVGTGEPVDEHTLFAIASTTKAFTVASLGMLVDQEVLDWDDPVIRWLPDFRLQDPYVTLHVTLRDLLTHRVGVAREDQLWIAGRYDRAEVMRRARHLPQVEPFRAEYGYNNIMYMVAGEVLSAAAGVSWDEFIQTRLFEPLGMTRSTTRVADVARRTNVASSHTGSGDGVRAMPHRDYDALGPAGSVFSSARDMAQWLRLHLAGGEYQGKRLLEEGTVAEMHQAQQVMSIGAATRRRFPTQNFAAYGLAWRLHDYHGRKVVQHTGNVNYMRTQVGMIPAEGIGVVVMANLSSSGLQTPLMYKVFDVLLGLPERDWAGEYLEEARNGQGGGGGGGDGRIEGTRPALALEDYAGTYADSLFGDVIVDVQDGGLVLRYGDELVADLEHWHHETFRGAWREPRWGSATVTFVLDARPRVRALDLQGYTEFGKVRED
jgi:CubicO group peptidase (beta-lactamase class C family)